VTVGPECSSQVAILNIAEGNARRFGWLVLTVGMFFAGYYYFWFTLLPALLPSRGG
jgi:hypothetical protein